jgi:hypothetical protein
MLAGLGERVIVAISGDDGIDVDQALPAGFGADAAMQAI